MRTLTLNYYQDPSHGWVKIKRDKLKQLGIDNQITHYSYQLKDNVYLEEDNDLATLYKACDNLGIKIILKEYHTNKQSKIRSYESYNNKACNTKDFMNFLSDNGQLEFIRVGF